MTGFIQSKTLELHYINGDSDGMVTAGMPGWTGHVLATPRTRIAEALRRKEAEYAGAYFLTGEQDGSYTGYIGESDNMSKRIKTHETKAEWWDRWDKAILVTSTDQRLHKTYILHLEASLIDAANKAGRIEKLENKQSPGYKGSENPNDPT